MMMMVMMVMMMMMMTMITMMTTMMMTMMTTMTMMSMMMRLRVIQLNEGMKMQTSHLWNRKFGSGRGITSIDLNQIPNLN